jgi:hypothetical protein
MSRRKTIKIICAVRGANFARLLRLRARKYIEGNDGYFDAN